MSTISTMLAYVGIGLMFYALAVIPNTFRVNILSRKDLLSNMTREKQVLVSLALILILPNTVPF